MQSLLTTGKLPHSLHTMKGTDMPFSVRWTIPASYDLKRELSYVSYENPDRASLLACNIRETLWGYARFQNLDEEGRIEGTRELHIPDDPYACICRIDEDASFITVLRLLRIPPRMIRHGHKNFCTPWTPFAVAEEVATVIGVRHDSWMQDWPIEVSDHTRLTHFVTCAENEHREEHFLAIMTLVLDSFDMETATKDKLLPRIEKLIERAPSLIGYWLNLSEENDNEGFSVTPWLRKLYARK